MKTKKLITKNYSLFKFLDTNRPTATSATLKYSLQNHGWMESRPLLCNQNYMVVDGQHRLFLASELGIPVVYEIVKTKDTKHAEELMLDLNRAQKLWRLQDFVHHFAQKKVPCYVALRDFEENHKLGITNSISICAKTAGKAKEIRAGKDLQLRENREDIARFVASCNKLFFSRQSHFVRAVALFHDKASQNQIKKLFSKHMTITQQPSTATYLNVFSNIVNKRSGDKLTF